MYTKVCFFFLILFFCDGLVRMTDSHVLRTIPDTERSNSLEDVVMEKIKAQILRSLDLPSPPKRSRPNKPPLQTLNQSSEEIKNRTMDDDPESLNLPSFAVFSEIDIFNATSDNGTRLRFQFPSHFSLDKTVSLELWLFKNNSADELQLTQYLYGTDVILQNISIKHQKSNVGWIRFEILPLIWFGRDQKLDIEVSCTEGCETDMVVSIDDEKKPFLIVNHNSSDDHTRVKRRIDCEEGQKTCCTARFHVSFAEIGWDWILEPRGYWANFCRGSCSYEMNLTRFHYNTVIISLIKNNSSAAENIGLKISCVPSKMASLPFIYENEHGIFIERHLPNMIVEDCDCA